MSEINIKLLKKQIIVVDGKSYQVQIEPIEKTSAYVVAVKLQREIQTIIIQPVEQECID